MTRRRYAIAMTVVMTAALCADRPAIAAPQAQRAQTASIASRVMERLSVSLRRVVPAVAVIETRRDETACIQRAIIPPALGFVQRQPVSPFQFRLPPPVS